MVKLRWPMDNLRLLALYKYLIDIGLSAVYVDVPTSERGPPVSGSDIDDGQRRPARRSARAVFGRLLENGAVPKLIVLTVSLCAIYILLRLSVDLLDVNRLSTLGLFAVYIDTVWALVNATNADVVATAAAYRAVVMPAFTDLVHTEISNLHQLITHFNHGLQRYTALCQRHTFKKLAPQTGWYKSSCIRNLHACRSVWYRFVWYKFLAHN